MTVDDCQHFGCFNTRVQSAVEGLGWGWMLPWDEFSPPAPFLGCDALKRGG